MLEPNWPLKRGIHWLNKPGHKEIGLAYMAVSGMYVFE